MLLMYQFYASRLPALPGNQSFFHLAMTYITRPIKLWILVPRARFPFGQHQEHGLWPLTTSYHYRALGNEVPGLVAVL